MTAWSPGDKVRLETPNFIIRSMEPEDVDDRFVSWFANETYMFLMGARIKGSRDEVVKHVLRMDNAKDFLLGIFARDTGLVIGWFRAYCRPGLRRAKLNILIGEKLYRGRKNIAELNVAILDFLFGEMHLHRVYTTVYGHNTLSRRLLERCGYRLEGLQRDHGMTEDGAWVDVAHFGMLASDWRAARDGADTG